MDVFLIQNDTPYLGDAKKKQVNVTDPQKIQS